MRERVNEIHNLKQDIENLYELHDNPYKGSTGIQDLDTHRPNITDVAGPEQVVR